MLEGIKNAIGVIAPTLATALGGPLAGAAVATIGKALGLGESAPAQQVLQHLQQMSPADQLALQQADNEFKIEMAKIASGDLQAAYDREKDLANSKWGWMSLSIMNIAGLNMLAILDYINYWGLRLQDDPQIQTMIITFDVTTAITCFLYYIWGKSKKED